MSATVAVTPAAVVAAARRLCGVRWQHQGRTLNGLDCAGLVIYVMHELGLSDFDTTDYGRLPHGGRMRALLDEHCTRVAQMQLGIVALMRFDAEPQHLAIIGDYAFGCWSLIHALAPARRVVESRLDAYWQARIVALYALPGVDYA